MWIIEGFFLFYINHNYVLITLLFPLALTRQNRLSCSYESIITRFIITTVLRRKPQWTSVPLHFMTADYTKLVVITVELVFTTLPHKVAILCCWRTDADIRQFKNALVNLAITNRGFALGGGEYTRVCFTDSVTTNIYKTHHCNETYATLKLSISDGKQSKEAPWIRTDIFRKRSYARMYSCLRYADTKMKKNSSEIEIVPTSFLDVSKALSLNGSFKWDENPHRFKG